MDVGQVTEVMIGASGGGPERDWAVGLERLPLPCDVLDVATSARDQIRGLSDGRIVADVATVDVVAPNVEMAVEAAKKLEEVTLQPAREAPSWPGVFPRDDGLLSFRSVSEMAGEGEPVPVDSILFDLTPDSLKNSSPLKQCGDNW